VGTVAESTAPLVDLCVAERIAAHQPPPREDSSWRHPRKSLTAGVHSALHASAAGFGDVDFYPDFAVKAAVLVVRLAKNHALPDGSKRAAWVSLRMFVEPNGWSWHTPPSVDETERAVLAIASGDWNEQDMTAWLRERISSSESNDPRAREAATAGPPVNAG